MVRLALVFLAVALLAGLFGFGLISETVNAASRMGFVIFLSLGVMTLLESAVRGEAPAD